MTNQEKSEVIALRKDGLTYLQIGERLGLSMNTVKSFCRRFDEKKKFCRNCGKPLMQEAKKKPRVFCCNHCRDIWWKANRDCCQHRNVYCLTCEYCGKCFECYRQRSRKYCSHNCYIECRFGRRGVP